MMKRGKNTLTRRNKAGLHSKHFFSFLRNLNYLPKPLLNPKNITKLFVKAKTLIVNGPIQYIRACEHVKYMLSVHTGTTPGLHDSCTSPTVGKTLLGILRYSKRCSWCSGSTPGSPYHGPHHAPTGYEVYWPFSPDRRGLRRLC